MGKANIAGRNSSSTSYGLCAFLADLRRAQGKSGLRSPGSMPRSPDMMSYPSGTRPHRGGPSLRSAGSRSLPMTTRARLTRPRPQNAAIKHHHNFMRHYPGKTWLRAGSMRHHPGRTWSRAGNMSHHPGRTWSRSGTMRHHPRRTWSHPGRTRSHIGETRPHIGSPGHRCPVLTRCVVMI